ncbi:hypothetical protein FZ983_24425 [Azospirillum sp. B21]|uniref:hypothetical protein n=1 Tax=unclassified Azospirillum TaxID=2630922 RepID=UPI0011EE5D5C|nr:MULTISPECIES: hypothetical protein [unclassified Azospirillum]KAA0576202.1 hypothetical protein FZ983_24425 [Azospirillum sp. B21]MDR6774682.1 hypothetical protein [Azospirillum sp. BE72]
MLTNERAPPVAPADWLLDIAWTDQDLVALCETILLETMAAAVDGRSCQRTRAEAWEWIDSDGEKPFGFRICAKALGADPDELRAMFRDQATKLGLIASHN